MESSVLRGNFSRRHAVEVRRQTHGPHPEERALARVSKDGSLHGSRLGPSFETPCFARLLRMRFLDDIDMIRTSETLYQERPMCWATGPREKEN
jgi:hypothetical protein